MKRNCNLHRITQTNHFNERKETFKDTHIKLKWFNKVIYHIPDYSTEQLY